MRGIVACFRRLSRDALFSVVNIGGLSVGMAAALLIMAWVYNQWSYDRFFAKDKYLYKLWCYDQEEGNFDAVSTEIGPAILDEVAGIINISRYGESEIPFSYNTDRELKFSLEGRHAVAATVDTCFLRMFGFKLLRGDLATVFADPFSMVVTQRIAQNIFGDQDPMGQTVPVFQGAINLKITGVLADLPPNTAFRFDLLVPYKTFSLSSGWYGRSRNNLTFVELAPHVDVKEVDASIREIISKHTGGHSRTQTYLQHISEWHLYSEFDRGISVGGRIKTLRMYGWIALLIMTIACINFMNLTTAQSAKRAKEAQLLKVIGLTRFKLIISSLRESMLLTVLAGLLALLWVSMALPLFHAIVGEQFHLALGKVGFWIAWGLFTGLTGLLAGSYPSLCFGGGLRLVSLRKILIVMQFSFAVILITATTVIQRQLQYAREREVGYNPTRLISVEVNDHSRPTCGQVRCELLTTGVAESVSINFGSMVGSESRVTAFEYLRWRGMDPENAVVFERNYAMQDWAATAGLQLVKGRDIDIANHPGDSTAMLLNETAVRVMGLHDPIGEVILGGGGIEYRVVGVIGDFVLESPYDPVRPMVIEGPARGAFNHLIIKLSADGSFAERMEQANKIFERYNNGETMNYKIIEEVYQYRFDPEKRIGSLVGWFAALAVFISCLGLFGLSAYMAEDRRKEIGIRKAHGATILNMVSLLSGEFLGLVSLSLAIGLPTAWWVMNRWLSGYAYRTRIPWWLLVGVAALTLGIAVATVSFHAVRAARANPIKSIKVE